VLGPKERQPLVELAVLIVATSFTGPIAASRLLEVGHPVSVRRRDPVRIVTGEERGGRRHRTRPTPPARALRRRTRHSVEWMFDLVGGGDQPPELALGAARIVSSRRGARRPARRAPPSPGAPPRPYGRALTATSRAASPLRSPRREPRPPLRKLGLTLAPAWARPAPVAHRSRRGAEAPDRVPRRARRGGRDPRGTPSLGASAVRPPCAPSIASRTLAAAASIASSASRATAIRWVSRASVGARSSASRATCHDSAGNRLQVALHPLVLLGGPLEILLAGEPFRQTRLHDRPMPWALCSSAATTEALSVVTRSVRSTTAESRWTSPSRFVAGACVPAGNAPWPPTRGFRRRGGGRSGRGLRPPA